MDKRFVAILAVVILGLGAIFFIGKNNANAPADTQSNTASTVSNHTKGESSKNVTLLVYGDFQCPVCSQYHQVEKQLMQKYGKDIAFTFRHFPLDTIHPNARAAARAAEAAGKQGKFFEMHDLLYENQNSWSSVSDPLTTFQSYATQLGLDVNQFKADFATETVNSIINADLKEGDGKGVTGTPTYFLNGEKLNNADLSSYEKFEAKIQEAINKAGK